MGETSENGGRVNFLIASVGTAIAVYMVGFVAGPVAAIAAATFFLMAENHIDH